MGLYDKINKMSNEPGTYDEKLYRLLIDENTAAVHIAAVTSEKAWRWLTK